MQQFAGRSRLQGFSGAHPISNEVGPGFFVFGRINDKTIS
jgi:hypothetical protein